MKSQYRFWTLAALALVLSPLVRAELPDNAVWIDVRTHAEYSSGHLPQATHIPYDGIQKGIAALNLPRDTPIYLYCAVGGRAEKAKKALEAIDYQRVTNVGGLADAQKLAAQQTP